jgi:predicted HAD superfamily Cof-like phosphohydrolase
MRNLHKWLEKKCPLCRKQLKNASQGCTDCGIYFCVHCHRWRGWQKGAADKNTELCDDCCMALRENPDMDVTRLPDWVRDVYEFRQACGLPIGSEPQMVSTDLVDLHFKLLREEIEELEVAIRQGNLAEIADAYVDLIYYAIGGTIAHGMDIRPVWQVVHRANMLKTTGPKRADGKQLKPPGWEPPNVELALRQGSLDELQS